MKKNKKKLHRILWICQDVKETRCPPSVLDQMVLLLAGVTVISFSCKCVEVHVEGVGG